MVGISFVKIISIFFLLTFAFCFCCQIYGESFSNSCVQVYFDKRKLLFIYLFIFGVVRRFYRFLVFLEIY